MNRKKSKRLEVLLARILVVAMMLSLFSGMSVMAAEGDLTAMLNFVVTDADGAVSEATVTVEGQEPVTTDENGNANVSFVVTASGTVSYMVSKDGYDNAAGTVDYTVDGTTVSPVTKNITLTKTPTTEEVTVTFTADPDQTFEVVLLDIDGKRVELSADNTYEVAIAETHAVNAVVKTADNKYMKASGVIEDEFKVAVDTLTEEWIEKVDTTVTKTIFSDGITAKDGKVIVPAASVISKDEKATRTVAVNDDRYVDGNITFTEPGEVEVVVTDLYLDPNSFANSYRNVTTVKLEVVQAALTGATVAVDQGAFGAASTAVGIPAKLAVTFTSDGKTLTDTSFLGLVNMTLNADSASSGNFTMTQDATTRQYSITANTLPKEQDEVSIYLDVAVTGSDFLAAGNFEKCEAPISFTKATTQVTMPSEITVNEDDILVGNGVTTLPAKTSDYAKRTITYTPKVEGAVTFDGTKITAISDAVAEAGSATIVATVAADGAYKAYEKEIKLNIVKAASFPTDKIEFEWLDVRGTKLGENYPGATYSYDENGNIIISYTLNDDAEKTWIYSTDNSDVATVDNNGVVTVKKAGTVTVTATAADNAKITKSYTLTIAASEVTPVFDCENNSIIVIAGEQATVELPVLKIKRATETELSDIPADLPYTFDELTGGFSLSGNVITLPTSGDGEETIVATMTSNDRYTVVEDTENNPHTYTVDVQYAELPEEDLFTASGANEQGWYVPDGEKNASETVLIQAVEGYAISTNSEYGSEWGTTVLTLDEFLDEGEEEGAALGAGKEIYIRHLETGAVYKNTLPGYQVDNQNPTLTVTFTQSVKKVVEENILYFYYNKTSGPLEITLDADDPGDGSGVDAVYWSEPQAGGGVAEAKVDPLDGSGKYSVDAQGNYVINTTAAPNFKETLTFKVVDKAGLSYVPEEVTDDEETVKNPVTILDAISPTISVIYSNVTDSVSEGSETKIFSTGAITATVKVTEEDNFDPNEIEIKVTGSDEYTVAWNDETQEATVTLHGVDNAETVYNISITGSDIAENPISDATSDYGSFSGNTYTSCDIVVDKKAPVISVEYSDPKRYIEKDENGVMNATDKDGADVTTAAYDAAATATITVKETYFNSGDFTIAVDDDQNAKIGPWSSDNGVHTATVTFDGADATEQLNSLTVDGEDIAGNVITDKILDEENKVIEQGTIQLGEVSNGVYTSKAILVDKKPAVISVEYSDPKRYIEKDENGVMNATDKDGAGVTTAAYDAAATATITVKETYFDSDDFTIAVDDDQNAVIGAWSLTNGSYTAIVTFDGKDATEQLNSLTVVGADIAGNVITDKILDKEDNVIERGTIQLGEVSTGKYTGKTILVDKKIPTAVVAYESKEICGVDTNENRTEIENATTIVYKDTIVTTLEVKEAYFDSDDCTVTVKSGKNTATNATVEWDEHNPNKATITIKAKDSTEEYYTITITGKDMVGHEIEFNSIVHATSKVNETQYVSKELLIDTKAPEVSIVYNNAANEGAKDSFYTASKAAITLVDTSFDSTAPAAIQTYSISGVDSSNKNIKTVSDVKLVGWTRQNDDWINSVDFNVEANYTFTISKLTDNAGNMAVITTTADGGQNASFDKETGVYTTQFTVDHTAPETFKFSYSPSVREVLINGLTHDFYSNSKALTLTVVAEDSISGVQTMEYTYDRTDCASETNEAELSKNYSYEIAMDKYVLGEDAVTESVTYNGTNGQLHGVYDYTVMDYAGNVASPVEEKAEDRENEHKVMVVDSICPTATVTYSDFQRKHPEKPANNEVSDYYFSKDSVAIPLVINEINFYEEDVTVSISTNGGKFVEVENLSWTHNKDQHTAYIYLTQPNSYYYFKVDYTDRSGNVMGLVDETNAADKTVVSYTSPRIVLDTTLPVIQVEYSGSSRITNGKPYYNSTAVATVTITETNFNAEDVQFTIGGKNIDGVNVGAPTNSAWTTEGDKHICTITYSADANYTFDVAYTDLATNPAVDYAPDEFCVDMTPPANLNISYSTDVWGSISSAILWYDQPVNVVLTCTDITAGIETITYSYPTANGVSTVNVGSGDITVSVNAGSSNVEYSFSIPSSVLVSANQFNGTVNFRAVDRSGNTTSIEGTNNLVVDNIAPNATVTYTEPVSSDDTTDYYSTAFEAVIEINEANFDPDDVTITVEKDGEEYTGFTYSFTDESVDVHVATIRFTENGEYVIKVQYTDMSQNELEGDLTNDGIYTSRIKIVDVDAPEILIKDMMGRENPNKIAYDDKNLDEDGNQHEDITFVVSFADDNLLAEDISVELSSFKPQDDVNDIATYGYVDENNLVDGTAAVITEGEEYSISVNNLVDDAVYFMSCAATDQAGNLTTSDVMFSVNRYGSTYYITDEATNDLLSRFWTNASSQVEIHEITVEELSQTNVTVVRDSTSSNLEKDSQYEVSSVTGEDENWNDYTYAVYKENFDNEGAYTVQTSSVTEVKDNGGTEKYYSSADDENAAIKFVMDTTIPEVYLSGLTKEEKTYPVDEQPIIITLSDNTVLSSATLIINGVETEIPVDEAFNGTYETVIPASPDDQTIQVLAYDMAGNCDNSVKFEGIRVNPNYFVLYREAFIIGGIILLVMLGVLVGVTVSKKKNRNANV